MSRRHWTELSATDTSDISTHLQLARNHPHTPAGQASTRALLKHYRESAEREMLAHHAHMSGRVRKGGVPRAPGRNIDPIGRWRG
jgi:hypothetical protein